MIFYSEEDFNNFCKSCKDIPLHFLKYWKQNPKNNYHCINCGTHYSEDSLSRTAIKGSLKCPTCNKENAIVPCVTAYCEFGEEIWT